METRRTIAIKLLAAVAGFFMLWPILIDLYFATVLIGEGMPLSNRLKMFLRYFEPSYGEIVSMVLWAALLVTFYKASKWALIFASLLVLETILALLAIWSIGGLLGPSGITVYTLIGIVFVLAPFFILEATFRLWRKGTLR